VERLPGMEPDAHPQRLLRIETIVFSKTLLNLRGAQQGCSYTGEDRHEAVPQGLDLLATVTLQFLTHQSMMNLEKLIGCCISMTLGITGKALDVAEKKWSRLQKPTERMSP
jgi:hypothetical protein